MVKVDRSERFEVGSREDYEKFKSDLIFQFTRIYPDNCGLIRYVEENPEVFNNLIYAIWQKTLLEVITYNECARILLHYLLGYSKLDNRNQTIENINTLCYTMNIRAQDPNLKIANRLQKRPMSTRVEIFASVLFALAIILPILIRLFS